MSARMSSCSASLVPIEPPSDPLDSLSRLSIRTSARAHQRRFARAPLFLAGTTSAEHTYMTRSIRFAVVGLGHFAQAAILPAIHRQRGATITALVSGTPQKLEELGQKYSVPHLCDYSQLDELLESGELDAAYIALPNDLHADAAVRCAA